MRALLHEAAAAVHPLVHAQRATAAGAAAAGLFTLGGYLGEQEQQRQRARQRWEEEAGWGPPPGLARPPSPPG